MPKIDIAAAPRRDGSSCPEPFAKKVGGKLRVQLGDAAGFKAGVANGLHLVNRSDQPARFLEIGSRAQVERGHYPDDDLAYHKADGQRRFTRKDGSAAT